jgi:hypothetical protein
MRRSTVSVLAGLLPVVAANIALWININGGLEACFPYWDGCYSVSRGIRSGAGLWLFKLAALPAAILMAWCWLGTTAWLGQVSVSRKPVDQWIRVLGVAGAVFSLVYALWLGTEGEVYRWLRRYGVVFYFAFTALAHLLLTSRLWKQRNSLLNGAASVQILGYLCTVVAMWGLGVASAFKRKLIDNPDFLDRVENALEWNFALVLSLAFVALAMIHRSAESGAKREQEPRTRATR